MPSVARKLRIGLGSFDLIKGVCLLIIIVAHSANCFPQNSRFIKLLQFLMIMGIGALPLFMLASGYGFRENSIKSMLKKTCSSLLLPYMMIGTAYTIICPFSYYPVYHSWQASFELGQRFFLAFIFGNKEPGRIVFGLQTEWNTAAWFFLALFWAHNLLNMVIKIKKPQIQFVSVILILSVYLFLNKQDINILSICDGLLAFILCFSGYLLKKNQLLLRFIHYPYTYVLLIPLSILLYFVPLSDSIFLGILLDLVFNICVSILLMFVGVLIGNLSWPILEPFKNIGIYSYWILCIHAVEMQAIPWMLIREQLSFSTPVEFCIELLIKALIITVCCIVLKNISRMRSKKRLAARMQAKSATKTA